MIRKIQKSDERGATLVEFSIAATVFIMAMFAVLEFGRALWTHNALTDAARRGARYATLQGMDKEEQVKNVVVYGSPSGGSKPVVQNLTTNNVNVDYDNYGLDSGTVTVTITEYDFEFVIPIVSTSIRMPSYSTTLTGESVGLIPATL